MRNVQALKRRTLHAMLGLLATIPVMIVTAHAQASGYAARQEVETFIAELVASEGFDAAALRRLFAQARYQPRVIAAMSRPLIAPPRWDEYASQFVNPPRIEAGIAFWRENAVALARAQEEFGVPAEVTVAIIGVETFYGRNTGSYRAFDALATLAFDYPRRADFFKNELKQFLLLMREQGESPLSPRGSYAGALGLPQFMPGSIRAYAIDYDGDGRIDLIGDPVDVVGSVANFLARHGWQPGQPVMEPVRIETQALDDIGRALDDGVTERRSISAWVRDGITGFGIPGDVAPDPVGLLLLEQASGPSYWMVFNNWYVLTRYNRSRLYASAVWMLAQALRAASTAAAR